MIEEHDPAAVRALAAAIIEQAVHDATMEPRNKGEEGRKSDALLFLLDATDGRLDRWVVALDLDADALRSRLRRRLRTEDAA